MTKPHLRRIKVAVGLFSGQDRWTWSCTTGRYAGFGRTMWLAWREWLLMTAWPQ